MLPRELPPLDGFRKGESICLIQHLVRALQATQYELERQQHLDSLKKNLEKRPEREELVERKTIPGVQ